MCIAIGVTSIGLVPFFKRLFGKLGIEMTPNMLHYLEVKDRSRLFRLKKIKTRDKKRSRNKQKYDKLLKEDTRIARKERARREGTYRTGMNLDGDDDDDTMQQPVTKKRRVYVCSHPFCLKKGHATTRSKKCLANPE